MLVWLLSNGVNPSKIYGRLTEFLRNSLEQKLWAQTEGRRKGAEWKQTVGAEILLETIKLIRFFSKHCYLSLKEEVWLSGLKQEPKL